LSWLRFSLESRLDEIHLVSLIVSQVCKHIGIDEVLTYQIELCAVEAVTNAIRHAYRLETGNEVTVLMTFDETRIDLEILDRGHSMAPQYVERLRNGSSVLNFDPSNIAALPESGMGLQIMREVMDETAYSTSLGINCLKLTKVLRA
jgi:serine/threonine-protein kinase RsbW